MKHVSIFCRDTLDKCLHDFLVQCSHGSADVPRVTYLTTSESPNEACRHEIRHSFSIKDQATSLINHSKRYTGCLLQGSPLIVAIRSQPSDLLTVLYLHQKDIRIWKIERYKSMSINICTGQYAVRQLNSCMEKAHVCVYSLAAAMILPLLIV